jgi:hypothetical protein
MIRRGSLSKADKIAACVLAAICVIGGSMAMRMAVVRVHWRLALASGVVLCLGGAYAIVAMRGRPLNERQPAHRVKKRGAKRGAP